MGDLSFWLGTATGGVTSLVLERALGRPLDRLVITPTVRRERAVTIGAARSRGARGGSPAAASR
jgi:hypothetical protein